MRVYFLTLILIGVSSNALCGTQSTTISSQPGKTQIASTKLTLSGNSNADSVLQKFVATNKDNPAAVTAANGAAADIKSHPDKFLNPDGSINTKALEKELAEMNAGNIAVSSPSINSSEGSR